MATAKKEYDPADDLAPGVFDIRDALADRGYPSDEIDFYLDEDLGYQLEKMSENLDKLLTLERVDEYNKAEKEFEKLQKQLRAHKYIARARGISQRNREDILSKTLAEFPYKRDLMGRDDGEQEFKRGNLQMTQFWEAFLYELEDPHGNKQEVTPEVVENMRGNLPAAAQRAINGLIEEVSGNTDWFRFAAQDTDFLSKP